MKKLIFLVVTLAMLMSANAFACHKGETGNVFKNPYFEIVATIKDAPSETVPDAERIGSYMYSTTEEETGKTILEETIYYADGSYVVNKLFDMEGYDAYPATKYFPGGFDDVDGFYVTFEQSEEKINGDDLEHIYLIDTNGDEIVKTLIGGRVSKYIPELYTVKYSVYFLDENGEISKTPAYEGLSGSAFEKLIYGSEYNDGLKFGKTGPEEEWSLSGYSDINDKVYFVDPVATYYNYFYNLGYLVEASNNGGIMDYSVEDPESQRVFCSSMTNVFTDENISFHDVNITDIFDSGYIFVDVKDETRKETSYIAKIKKPAVIRVMIDGEKVRFDVLPAIKDGRTLVPLRAIFEALGADVVWDGENQKITATKGDLSVELIIGSNEIKVGSETKTLDVAAQIVDGRTLVPARAIAESFGCNVEWKDAERAVIITTK